MEENIPLEKQVESMNNLFLTGLTILLVLLFIAFIEVEKDLKDANATIANLKEQVKVEKQINKGLYQELKFWCDTCGKGYK